MTDMTNIAGQQRETVEMQRLIEETSKFVAEQHKLMAEASSGSTAGSLPSSSCSAGWARSPPATRVSALLHIAGLK